MSNKKLMSDLNELAALAKVPAPTREQFLQEVQFAIEGAHRLIGMNWSKPATADISALLKDLTANAQILADKIQAMSKEAGASNKEYFARMAFAGALHDKKLSISDALGAITKISESAADAAKETIKLGRSRGTTQRPAFDAFATTLYLAARQAGGNLTIYKSDGKWSGSFLKAFSILKSHLPEKNFLPVAVMGRVLDRIAAQYRR
jgi:hypothetical protein